jgi:hypothetical protein
LASELSHRCISTPNSGHLHPHHLQNRLPELN